MICFVGDDDNNARTRARPGQRRLNICKFFCVFYFIFLFGAILGAKKIKHEIMSAFNFFWAITHKLAINQFSKKTNYKLF